MGSWSERPPRDTGPIEVRDFGPNGRRLGTFADCYDGSPWELHRGELVEQMGSKDLQGIAMAIAAALFHAHSSREYQVLTDVYCDLSDEHGASLRAPDVTLVRDLEPKNEVITATPVLAVEVRGTQSKRYLEEKVQLYLEHDWPLVWILHVERGVAEVFERGLASVSYAAGAEVPLPLALQAQGLKKVPVEALFDRTLATNYVADHLVEAGKQLGLLEGQKLGLRDGLERGKRLGLDEGKRLGLSEASQVAREAVADVCELLGIPLDEARRAELATLDLPALAALRARLKRDRRW